MNAPWYVDLHQASSRGVALEELVRIRCTRPFEKEAFYGAADIHLRARRVRYADLAGILNQRDEGVVRMRVRDWRNRPLALPPAHPKISARAAG